MNLTSPPPLNLLHLLDQPSGGGSIAKQMNFDFNKMLSLYLHQYQGVYSYLLREKKKSKCDQTGKRNKKREIV